MEIQRSTKEENFQREIYRKCQENLPENSRKTIQGTSVMSSKGKVKIARNIQKAPRRHQRIRGWELKVSMWIIPHESEASTMLRNFFLMLIKIIPRNELQEAYVRRVVLQKEIIFKEMNGEKLKSHQAIMIMQEAQKGLLSWGIKLGLRMRTENYFQFWSEWVREIKFGVSESMIVCEGKNCKGITLIMHNGLVLG
jgi:hypothetical protein